MASRRISGTFTGTGNSDGVSCNKAIIDVTHSGTATVNLQWQVDGKTHDIRPTDWFAHRDHSWGVRWQHNLYTEAQGFQPPQRQLGFLGDWHIFQFDDWYTCSSLREDHNAQVLHLIEVKHAVWTKSSGTFRHPR